MNFMLVKASEQGFTLMEVLVVVVIIGILAGIAIPSYRQYVIRNAEAEVQSQMGRLEVDLESWRTSALSYRGFVPKNGQTDASGNPQFGYGDAANTLIYVPLGSNNTNYRYQIQLLDGSSNTGSLVPAATPATPDPNATVEVGVGRSWVMRAIPNPTGVAGTRGRVFVQRSTGLKCATPVSNEANLPVTTTDCTAANLETW